MDKSSIYNKLVEKRKGFRFSHLELVNPSSTGFDINEVEPWAQWQNNLDAEILLIGQEFCDIDTYSKVKGTVEQYPNKFEYPANKNLHALFKDQLEIDIGHPLEKKKAPVFMTNAVMGLKSGTMSANFKDSWLKESREEFLKPLIEIIQPKIIISIGSKPALTLSKLYDFQFASLKKIIQNSPIEKNGIKIFSVYHCGGLGLASRNFELQKEDWKKIKTHLN